MPDEFSMRPIFAVRDVAASVAYYCEKLGFIKVWDHGEDRLIVAQVGRNGLDIILDGGTVMPRPTARSVIAMSLTQQDELGALHRELRGRGANIAAPPFEVVWQKGTYEMNVEDLDGNILVFWGNPP